MARNAITAAGTALDPAQVSVSGSCTRPAKDSRCKHRRHDHAMALSLKTSIRALLVAAAFLTSSAAVASPTACPQHFLSGQAPTLANPKLTAKTRELCYSGYAALHSGLTRTPLWSA